MRAASTFTVVVAAATAFTCGVCRADSLIDEGIRAAMLQRADGRIAHVETEYNDVFITKRQSQLVMSFQVKAGDYTESVSNLADPTICRCAMRK